MSDVRGTVIAHRWVGGTFAPISFYLCRSGKTWFVERVYAGTRDRAWSGRTESAGRKALERLVESQRRACEVQ